MKYGELKVNKSKENEMRGNIEGGNNEEWGSRMEWRRIEEKKTVKSENGIDE